MKYCQYCGAEVKDEARFCQNCGKQCRTDYQSDFSSAVNDDSLKYNNGVYYDTTAKEPTKTENPTLAILSLVFSILGFGLVGIILGIISLVRYHTTKYKVMGGIAIVICIIWTIVAVSTIISTLVALIQSGSVVLE